MNYELNAYDEAFLPKYKSRSGPDEEFNPNDPKYYLDKIQKYYGQLSSLESNSLIYADWNMGPSRRSGKTLRDYGRGLQDVSKYMRQIGYTDGEIQKLNKTYLSHAPFPLWTKFRAIVKSKLEDLKLKPTVVAEDPTANQQKLYMKNKLIFARQPETQANVPPGMIEQDGFTEARTPDDVEFMFQIGGVKLPIEVDMKDLLDHSLKGSGYETLETLLFEDLIDLRGMAVDLVLRNGKLVPVYIDFNRVIVRNSIFPDFRDSDVMGYTSLRKISDIMMYDKEAVMANWDQLKDAYSGRFSWDSNQYRNSQNGFREDYSIISNSMDGYYDYGTHCVKLYWLDVEHQYYVVGKHSRGARVMERVDKDFKLSERAIRKGEKEIRSYPIQHMMQCNWIAGTDIIFDYGPVDMITSPGNAGNKEIMFPMIITAANEPSLTEKVIPYIDDVEIAIRKRKDLIAKLPPGPRMILYKNRMKDRVQLGEEEYTVTQMLKLYQREGLFVVDEDTPYSLPGEDRSSSQPPIDFLPSGISEDINILEGTIAMSVDRIRQITGINPVVDGTATKGDILKSVAESMQTSANNALRPWMKLYIEFFKRMNLTLTWRYQLLVATGQIDVNNLPVSPAYVRLATMGLALLRYSLNIHIEISDAARRQLILQDLLSKRDMLPPGGYLAIMGAIEDDDMRKAQWLMIKFTRQAEAQAHKRQMEVVERQAMAQGEAGAMIEQARAQAEQTKVQGQRLLQSEKAGIDEQLATTAHQRDLEKIQEKALVEGSNKLQIVRENKKDEPY